MDHAARFGRCPIGGHGAQMLSRSGFARCRSLVADLVLPQPFSVSALVRMLADLRGRPIHVRTLPTGFGVTACGVWISTAVQDVIFVERKTSLFHREHITLHELGHLLCDHRDTAGGGHPLASLFPDLSPELIERVLTRTSYTTDEEQEAELVASLIRTAARNQRSWTTGGALGGLEAALGIRGE